VTTLLPLAVLLLLAIPPLPEHATTQTFNFTGAQQNFVVPPGVTQVTVEAFGAQGGTGFNSGGAGANGGSVTATISVTPGESLAVFVGGAGGAGGNSAGGAGGNSGGCGGTYGGGAGGGGQYGGGGGGGDCQSANGGGGGSSFTVAGATNVTHQQGIRTGDGQDIITFAVSIPTLSEWAYLGMMALLVLGGLLALRRRARPT
jgi:hypothetical protein